MRKTIGLVLFVLFMFGCSSHNVQEVTVGEMSDIFDMHTLNHTVYLGSDSSYHYFSHHKLTGSERYKISKEKARMIGEFPLSQKAPELFSRSQILDLSKIDY